MTERNTENEIADGVGLIREWLELQLEIERLRANREKEQAHQNFTIADFTLGIILSVCIGITLCLIWLR